MKALAASELKASVVVAGFSCMPSARCGNKLGLRDAASVEAFADMCGYIKRNEVMGFVGENVLDLASQNDGKDLQWYLNKLREAGLTVKMATVNAVHWRNGLWRKRLWFVGLRTDIADVTGFHNMEPPVEPIVCRTGQYKSAADLIRYVWRDHSVDRWYYLDCLPSPWRIQWGKQFDTQEKREALELPDRDRAVPPMWMGYLDDGSGRTLTGFKVGSAKWGAYPITSSAVAEGLGRTQTFYHVIEPKTSREYITTMPVDGHQKAFGL